MVLQSVSHYQGFGGVGDSGYGRYGGGFEGYKHFSNRKAILIKKPIPNMIREQLQPPYTPAKVARIEKIFVKCCMYNQSDIARLFYYALGVLALILSYFYLL